MLKHDGTLRHAVIENGYGRGGTLVEKGHTPASTRRRHLRAVLREARKLTEGVAPR